MSEDMVLVSIRVLTPVGEFVGAKESVKKADLEKMIKVLEAATNIKIWNENSQLKHTYIIPEDVLKKSVIVLEEDYS